MTLLKFLKLNHFKNSAIIFLSFIFSYDVFYKLSSIFYNPISSEFFFIFPIIFLIFFIFRKTKGIYIFLSILLFEFILRFFIIDFSSDGVTYHNPARMFIANGGNLFLSNQGDIRIDSHPTLPWVFSSLFYKLTSNNSQLTFGTVSICIFFFLYIYNYLKPFQSKFLNIIFALLTAFSPIFWSQVFSGYTDYYTYALLSWSILSFLIFYKEMSKENFLVFCLLSSLCLTAKYTSLIFYIIIFFPIALMILLKKNKLYFHIMNAFDYKVYLIALLCCFSIAWTYGQNFYFHKTPFPPTTLSKNADHVLDNNFYRNEPKYKHYFYSLFSQTNLNTDQPILKIPGKISIEEINFLNFADNRFGASGPLFSLIFLLSIITCFFSTNNKITLYFVTIIILISFCFPGTWQVRFFPLIQIVPCLILIANNKKLLNYGLLILMTLNTLLWATGSTYGQIKKTVQVNNFVKNLDTPIYISFGSWFYYKNILQKKGLKILDKKPPNSKCVPLNNIYNIAFHEDIKVCE